MDEHLDDRSSRVDGDERLQDVDLDPVGALDPLHRVEAVLQERGGPDLLQRVQLVGVVGQTRFHCYDVTHVGKRARPGPVPGVEFPENPGPSGSSPRLRAVRAARRPPDPDLLGHARAATREPDARHGVRQPRPPRPGPAR
ncbi:hypothetical protein MIU24_26485 [Streptomyces venezuelae]